MGRVHWQKTITLPHGEGMMTSAGVIWTAEAGRVMTLVGCDGPSVGLILVLLLLASVAYVRLHSDRTDAVMAVHHSHQPTTLLHTLTIQRQRIWPKPRLYAALNTEHVSTDEKETKRVELLSYVSVDIIQKSTGWNWDRKKSWNVGGIGTVYFIVTSHGR